MKVKMMQKPLALLPNFRQNKIMTPFVLNLHLYSFFLCLFTLESRIDVPLPTKVFENSHKDILAATPPPPANGSNERNNNQNFQKIDLFN